MSKQVLVNGIYNMVTCSKCKCQFAFEKTDIETKDSGEKVVTCPQCDTECGVQTP